MFILRGMPKGVSIVVDSCPPPERPGAFHGEKGPRLVVTSAVGLASSRSTGCWRWCAGCSAWKKAVGVLWPLGCLTCGRNW